VRIDARMLSEATGWLENYRKLWEENFDRLDTLLEELKAKDAADSQSGPETRDTK
jgi:hypothetical protein